MSPKVKTRHAPLRFHAFLGGSLLRGGRARARADPFSLGRQDMVYSRISFLPKRPERRRETERPMVTS